MTMVLYDERKGDAGYLGDLATNSGYRSFGRWVEDLPVEDYEWVVHLWEHGWVNTPKILAKQLTRALKDYRPKDKNVHIIATNFRRLLSKAIKRGSLAVIVTN
ncbi:MAG: hypothetical protein WAN65_09375 [Candidatus Sulfotelmatobacter sp.]